MFNWLKKIATKRSGTANPAQWFIDWVTGGESTASGMKINNANALNISTVFACIDCISSDTAKLPLHVYQKVNDYRKKQYNRLHQILNYQANPMMTAIDFRQALTAHVLGWGNGYAEIQRDGGGRVIALWPLAPDRTEPKLDSQKRLYYEVTNQAGGKVRLATEDVLHIHGLSFDGIVGYNVIHHARESLGLARASEKFGASWFGNGAHPSGTLEHPNTMSDKAHTNFKEALKTYRGTENANKLLVLEEGMKFNKVTVNPEESQFLETRKFTVPEICRWFRMKPHKVADLERATFTNIEHQNLEYVIDTLSTWFVKWEQALWQKLLTEKEKAEGYYFKHNANAMLRGDIKTRYEAYHMGIIDGWINRNEVRDFEDLNPVEGLDEYLLPLNMETLDRNAKIRELEEKAKTDPDAARQLEEIKFKRDLVKAFLADKTTNDVLFNMTNVQELLHEAGVASMPKYEEPWLPIISKEGPLVSGETKKDSSGDIVGGQIEENSNSNSTASDGDADADDDSIRQAHKQLLASQLQRIIRKQNKQVNGGSGFVGEFARTILLEPIMACGALRGKNTEQVKEMLDGFVKEYFGGLERYEEDGAAILAEELLARTGG